MDNLKLYQEMPLEAKTNLSYQRIKQWYDYFQGQVYVAFSGGKDSTVLLYLVREFYPQVPAVFCNTGLEYPEIIKFVRSIDNVIWLKPKYTFKQIIEKYGYPVISKAQAKYIYEYRNAKSQKTKNARWFGKYGKKMYKISEKWKYLVDAPFKISDKCCLWLKKNPSEKYEKETGRKPMMGTMAIDSHLRQLDHQKYGCNAFDKKRQQSRPMSFWKTEDVWEYIQQNNISYSKIYDMGLKHTGCIFCGFGANRNDPNRFQIMKKIHPKLWVYGMEKLGLREIFSYCGIPVE